MKVRIDSVKCQGHGRCYDLAPQVFTDDEEGYSKLIDPSGVVPPGDEELARLAVANCPESAIEIVEED